MSFMELYLVLAASLVWGNIWSKENILFHCDNMGSVDIINKGRSN